MDLTELVKELEKQHKIPVEIDVKLLGEKGFENITYGEIKNRKCRLVRVYNGVEGEIKYDLERLVGDYDSFDSLRSKLSDLSKLDGGIINNGIEGKLREEAYESATTKTFLGSKFLYKLFRGRFGTVFHDTNKAREILTEKFTENNIEFLHNHYVLALKTLYVGSSDCHGFISGFPVAKIEYELLK